MMRIDIFLSYHLVLILNYQKKSTETNQSLSERELIIKKYVKDRKYRFIVDLYSNNICI